MIKRLLFILLFLGGKIFSQPYIDPLDVRYMNASHNASKSATPFTHLYIGSDLPIKLKNKGFLVFSPSYESWNIDSASGKNYLPEVNSVALPVSIIIPLNSGKWSVTATVMPRINSEGLKITNSFQLGGAFLANYKMKDQVKLKFGLYVNNEFFGIFVMPLVGIEWQINERDNIFGVLPGRLTYEHRLNKIFYTGVTFRAITNSYRLDQENYLRIDDNQISAYIDFYVTKHMVFSGEGGYGILRKLRSGTGYNKNYLIDYNWGDGIYFKMCASYRIRL